MAILNALQVAQLVYNAGWHNVNDVATATAIAKRESGFNTQAHNPKPPDNSYGLFQINMLGSLGPARRKQFGIANNEALFDGATNARAAMIVYKQAGNSWKPWSTYRGLTITADARDAANRVVLAGGNVPGGSAPTVDPLTATPVNAITDAGDALGKLKDLVKLLSDPQTWVRLSAFVIGAILVLYGLMKLTGAGKGLTNVVLKSTTGGLVSI